MPEIPVGRIEFSVSGKRYELSGPDISVSPPVSASALINAASAEGAAKERARIRAKVEKMWRTASLAIPAYDSGNPARGQCMAEAEAFEVLLRWLDEESTK